MCRCLPCDLTAHGSWLFGSDLVVAGLIFCKTEYITEGYSGFLRVIIKYTSMTYLSVRQMANNYSNVSILWWNFSCRVLYLSACLLCDHKKNLSSTRALKRIVDLVKLSSSPNSWNKYCDNRLKIYWRWVDIVTLT